MDGAAVVAAANILLTTFARAKRWTSSIEISCVYADPWEKWRIRSSSLGKKEHSIGNIFKTFFLWSSYCTSYFHSAFDPPLRPGSVRRELIGAPDALDESIKSRVSRLKL